MPLTLGRAGNVLFGKSQQEKERVEKETRRRASQMTIDFMLFGDRDNLSRGAKVFDKLGFARTVTSLKDLELFIQYKTEQGNCIQRTNGEVLLNGIPLMASDGTKIKAPSPQPGCQEENVKPAAAVSNEEDLLGLGTDTTPVKMPSETERNSTSRRALHPGFELAQSPSSALSSSFQSNDPCDSLPRSSVASSPSQGPSTASYPASSDEDLLVCLDDFSTRPRSISGQIYDEDDFNPRTPMKKESSRGLLSGETKGIFSRNKSVVPEINVVEHEGVVMDATHESNDDELIGFDMRPSSSMQSRFTWGGGVLTKAQRVLQDSPTKKLLPNAITQERSQVAFDQEEAEDKEQEKKRKEVLSKLEESAQKVGESSSDGMRRRSWASGTVVGNITESMGSIIHPARLSPANAEAEKERKQEQMNRIKSARKSASGVTVDYLMFSSPENLARGVTVMNETLAIAETIKSLSALKLGHVYKTEQGNELVRPTLSKALLNEVELKVPGQQ